MWDPKAFRDSDYIAQAVGIHFFVFTPHSLFVWLNAASLLGVKSSIDVYCTNKLYQPLKRHGYE